MEKYFGDAAAFDRLRFDVFDIGDGGGEEAFVLRSDALFHVLCAQANVIPKNRDNRNVDVRENVDGRADDYQRADQQNQQRQYDESVGPVEGDLNDPHRELILWMRGARGRCIESDSPLEYAAFRQLTCTSNVPDFGEGAGEDGKLAVSSR